jgi:hypothetical protein
MSYVAITIMPEIVGTNLVVFGPFENSDEAEEFLEAWIDAHPGTHGIVRRLIRPIDRLWDTCGKNETSGLTPNPGLVRAGYSSPRTSAVCVSHKKKGKIQTAVLIQ